MKFPELAILATFTVTTMAHADPNASPTSAIVSDEVDPYLWLEEVDGKRAMDWVKARNAETVKELASTTTFKKMQADILEVLDSKARIPAVHRMGDLLYNFWRDQEHPRGLWRRTTLDEYKKESPAWKVIIDVDGLARDEKENWVWHGVNCLKPEYRHCLVQLSRGGADAEIVREFDLKTMQFVKDGFYLPEAKSNVSWKGADALYVGTDFGAGSMTASGYARIAKEWKRGSELVNAKVVYQGKAEDVGVQAYHDATPGFERDFVNRGIDTFNSETFVVGKKGALTKIDAPTDADVSVERQWLLIQTRTPWTVGGQSYPAGALLASSFDGYMAGKRQLTVLFVPTASTSLSSFSWTKNHLILNLLEDVVSRIEVLTPPGKGAGEWKRATLGGAPELCTVTAFGSDDDRSDEYFVTVTGYLTPTSFARGVVGQGTPEVLKQTPAFFDASARDVHRHFAISKDGTRIPYFVLAPKALQADGKNPTLLYGYGGFEISLEPGYSGSVGRAWLDKGGVYVVANIRGGGEYGPRWHHAALRENRLRAYEDFAAVAEDLFAKKITSPQHLGMEGRSNGGLLAGNMLILYPQLWKAVVSWVPLLDMKRYTHLSAGASWIGEYGDPDKPEEWKFIQTFSPYHNVKKGAKYPAVFFVTSTRDDRVGPVHARKMAAKMIAMGNDARFYENIEGGHGGAADNKETAFVNALEYTFLWEHVK